MFRINGAGGECHIYSNNFHGNCFSLDVMHNFVILENIFYVFVTEPYKIISKPEQQQQQQPWIWQ